MKTYISLLSLIFAISLFGCSPKIQDSASSQSAGSDLDAKEMRIDKRELNPEFALETYLRRTPGVTLQGSGNNAKVTIRGVNSLTLNTEPLFIINGNPVGNTYVRAANVVRGMEIKSVKVLKGSDASLYGVRGAGGVVIITAR